MLLLVLMVFGTTGCTMVESVNVNGQDLSDSSYPIQNSPKME